jgi:hypothetical protein
MNVELDWLAANDDDVWEPITAVSSPRSPTRRRWLWGAWIPALLLLAAASALVLAHRYAQARDRIAFQIQSVIDLETRTFAEGAMDLFLAQQDPTPHSWYQRRATCAANGLQPVRGEAPLSCAHVLADVAPGGAVLASPPQVQAIGLRGDVAWAEVVSGPQRTRQVRFYRQTDQGWLHTAPDASYWGDALEQTHGGLTVHYRERDLPYLEPLIQHAIAVDSTLCAMLDCPAADRLALQFIPHSMSPALLDDRIVLSSPWLSGIPPDWKWDQGYLDELAYWVVYARASRFVRSNAGGQSGETGPLNEAQQAVLGEYAFLYSQSDPTRAPFLRRIVGAYGTGALEEVLRSTQDGPTPSQFLARWPLAFPERTERSGFEALVGVAGEAVQAGRLDTFDLVAGLLAEDGTWQAGTIEYLHALN